jgi:catabolite repression protein CreC
MMKKLRDQSGSHQQRMSMMSSVSLALRRRGESVVFLGGPGVDPQMSRFHPAPSRNEVAVVQPVLVREPTFMLLPA